jgi:hypothetical protein
MNRCANTGFVVEKPSQAGLADAFSQHISAWKPRATWCFFLFFTSCARRKKQGHLRSRMGDRFHNPVQARLRRDLEAQRQLGLRKQSPALFCSLFYQRIS